MPAFLSDEWLTLQCSLANDLGLGVDSAISLRIQFVVTGAPTGDMKYHWIIDAGKLRAVESGEIENPDVSVTTTWADAVAIQQGTLDPNVAFMQGKLKIGGNMNAILQLLPLTASDVYRDLQKRLSDLTEF